MTRAQRPEMKKPKPRTRNGDTLNGEELPFARNSESRLTGATQPR